MWIEVETLFQTADAHPALARGEPPPGLLSREEAVRFSAIQMGRRRQSWLLGRWTAKLLLHSYFIRQTGENPPLSALEIMNESDGSPACRTGPVSVCLTISHSGPAAFCAVTGYSRYGLGADLECVEPRPEGFALEYFTPGEIEQVRNLTGTERDRLVTAIWSGKEAALKALRLGLSVDTRSVDCCFSPVQVRGEDWQSFQIRTRLPSACGNPARLAGFWRRQSYWQRQAYWRRQADFVETLSVACLHSDQSLIAGQVQIVSASLTDLKETLAYASHSWI